ncbi:MAG: GAF domain-containing protein [Chloroflexota bacterium]
MHSNDRRLRILNELKLLKTEHTDSFDRLTRIATTMLDAPVSLATMLADDYQYFVGMTGINDEPYTTTRSTPLSMSFCQYVVTSGEPLIIQDAREDDLLRDNLAIPELGVISYLGIPITTSDGDVLGSFCVIMHEPRDWTAKEVDMLTELTVIVTQQVEHLIDMRARHLAELDREQFKALRVISHQIANALLAPITSIQMKITLLERTTHDTHIIARLEQTQTHLNTVRSHLREFMEIASITVDSDTRVNAAPLVRSAVYSLATHRNETILPTIELDAQNHTVQANAKLLRFAFKTLLTHLASHDEQMDTLTIQSCNRDDTLEVNFLYRDLPTISVNSMDAIMTTELEQVDLMLIKHVIKALQGSFSVESAHNAGTIFSIKLPLAS